MKNKVKILLFIFVAFEFQIAIQAQSGANGTVSEEIQRLRNSSYNRKNEIADLKKELELLKIESVEPLRINDSLKFEIDRLKRLDSDRQTQLETLIDISGNTSSTVGNKLDAIAILLGVVGLFLSIAAIALGIYINRKEKKISDLLDRSDKNLKRQAESEQKAEETRELINKDLTSLYKKLRGEELKDILKRVEAEPQQIRIHTSRLLTLDMREEHFVHLKNLFFKWSMDDEHKYFNANLTILLISHFPSDVAVNQELLPMMKYHFDRTFISIGIDRLNIFLQKLLEEYFENKYPEVNNYLLSAIKALSENYNPNYVAIKMLFEANDDKEKRFKIYNLIKQDPSILMLNPLYKQQMINTYSDAVKNTAAENQLIEEMKGGNTPQNNASLPTAPNQGG